MTDGCEAVRHEDHIDHVHDGERHVEQAVHPTHEGTHSDGGDYDTVQHEGHVDHMHDGHRHFRHGDHVDEH